ncbi:transcription factor ORG2 [Prunus persica]|nr:transcription factor ORG2 [Prunus persica]
MSGFHDLGLLIDSFKETIFGPFTKTGYKQIMINEGNEFAESFLHCVSPHQRVDQFEFTPSSPMSGGRDLTVVKKLNHNASERDDRKKINTLYSTLRSLLPASYQMKKLSNPAAISRAVKYIPELQQQVKGLIQKKEELLSRLRRLQQQGDPIYNEKQSRSAALSSLSASAFAVSWLNDREVVLQISSYVVQKSPLSQILVDLEEDGLLLLNASSFESFEGRLFCSLHIQVERTCRMECNILNEKNIIPLMCDRRKGCFPC